MAEGEKRVMEILTQAIPKMTELERERMIGFAEGLTYQHQDEAQKKAAKREA